MRKLISFILISFFLLLYVRANDININQTYSDELLQKTFTAASEVTINDQLDYNLDSSGILIDSMHFTTDFLNLIKGLQIQDYRFPGGTIGNYYHFFGNGHGIDTTDFACKPRQGFVYDQINFDQFFSKNLMHYFVEFIQYMQQNENEVKGIFYHLNIYKHFIHKQLMVANLLINQGFNTMFDSATIDLPLTSFSATDLDYYVNMLSTVKRHNFTNAIKSYLINDSTFNHYFKENIAAINFLLANNIKVKGIELGNESQAEYLLYDDDLSLLNYDCNNVPDDIEVNGFDNLRMRDYLEGIYKFWIITSIYADFIKANYYIPTGVPASLHYAYLFIGNDDRYQVRDNYGLVERQAHLWNRFLANDTTYDAMIPHFYTQQYIPCQDYDSIVNENAIDIIFNYSLDFLKKSAEDLFNYQMTNLVDDIGNKRIWITEWNLNKNTYMNNTFLHSYYIQQMFLNAIKIQEQNLFNIDTWIIHNLASSSYVFALVQSASRGNGHSYKKYLGADIFEMWNTTLNHKVKRLNYDWKTLFNTSNTYINIDGFINETKDSIILHFANPTNDTILLDFNTITFSSDSIFIGTVVNEYILNANSWQSNNTACFELASDTLNKSYIIKNKSIDIKSNYTIPHFSIGKITIALQKDIPSKINNITSGLALKLYPSLSNYQITIEVKNKQQQNYKYQISDILGKVIDEFYNNTPSFSITTQHYENGLYLLSVKNEYNNFGTTKFVVQH